LFTLISEGQCLHAVLNFNSANPVKPEDLQPLASESPLIPRSWLAS